MPGFSCDKCSKAFATKKALDQHARSNPRSHLDVTPEAQHQRTRPDARSQSKMSALSCDKCSKTFSTKEALDQHMRSNPRSHPIECDYCCRRFKSLEEKKKHVDVRYQCRLCKATFCDEVDLGQHQYDTHMNNCMRCGLRFDDKHSALKHFIKKHLDAKEMAIAERV